MSEAFKGWSCFCFSSTAQMMTVVVGAVQVVTSIDISNHLSCNHQLYEIESSLSTARRCEYPRTRCSERYYNYSTCRYKCITVTILVRCCGMRIYLIRGTHTHREIYISYILYITWDSLLRHHVIINL